MNTIPPALDEAAIPSWLALCREGFEEALRDEIRAHLAERHPAAQSAVAVESGAGYVRVSGAGLAADAPLFPDPFVFERQRLERAVPIAGSSLKQTVRHIVRTLLPPIARASDPWTLHVFAAAPDAPQPLTQRALHLREALLAFCQDRFTAVFRRYRPPEAAVDGGAARVLQVCLMPDAAWGAVMPFARLTDPFPGGLHRMRFDAGAPSRSYLKIEEAFARLGETPRPRQRVVDLGAAPGGWSYAFLKRGCRVLAVDHGPLQLNDTGAMGGTLLHRRVNGLTFQPPDDWRPVDWLVSDMLVPPGQALGVLRRWLENGWLRRFVVTLKLPQQHPYPALRPIADYLRTQPGVRFAIRQLYHDRREVTAYGRLAPGI